LGLHKQTIYDTLASLVLRDVVTESSQRGVKLFTANDPDVLLQENITKRLQIEDLLPDLYAHMSSADNSSSIKIHKGVAAFHAFHYSRLKNTPANSKVDVLGAGGDEFLQIAKQRYFFTRYENLRIDKKIHHRLLIFKDQKDSDKEYIERRYIEAKFLKNALPQPFATQIWPSSVSLFLFGDEPQIIEIKNKKITEGFRNYFELLWKQAKT